MPENSKPRPLQNQGSDGTSANHEDKGKQFQIQDPLVNLTEGGNFIEDLGALLNSKPCLLQIILTDTVFGHYKPHRNE